VRLTLKPKSMRWANDARQSAVGGWGDSKGLIRRIFSFSGDAVGRWIDKWDMRVGFLFSRIGALRYYQADVAIIGSNPILNVLYALSLNKLGISVVICPVYDEEDAWNYALLQNSGYRKVIEGCLGVDIERKDLKSWIDEFFRVVDELIKVSNIDNKITWVEDGFGYDVDNGVSEVMISMISVGNGKLVSKDDTLRYIVRSFQRVFLNRMKAVGFSSSVRDRRFLFVKRVLLTGNISTFPAVIKEVEGSSDVQISYENKRIHAVSSAKYIVSTREGSVKQCVSDILMITEETESLVNGLVRN